MRSGWSGWRAVAPAVGLAVWLGGCSAAVAQPTPELEVPLPVVEASALEGEGGSAARAFAEGHPAEAARRYEVLLKTRGVSADLLYNLGTSSAWAEDYGRAIWALERARLLSPRDGGIAHNLDVTRQRVRVRRMQNLTTGKLTDGEPGGVFLLRTLTWGTEGEYGVLIVLLNLLMFGALIARRPLREGGARDGMSVLAGLLGLLLVVAVGLGVAQSWVRSSVRVGVILDGEVPLHEAPSATAVHRAHPDLFSGATVRLVEQRPDGWTQVEVVDGKTGWLLSSKLGEIR